MLSKPGQFFRSWMFILPREARHFSRSRLSENSCARTTSSTELCFWRRRSSQRVVSLVIWYSRDNSSKLLTSCWSVTIQLFKTKSWFYKKASMRSKHRTFLYKLKRCNFNCYTLNSPTLFWLAESAQGIFEISARDVITADCTIIMSRLALNVTGNHIKFARFELLPVSEEAKHDSHFFRSIKQQTTSFYGLFKQ